MKIFILNGNFNFHNDLFAVLRWNGSTAACLSLWLPTTDVNCSIVLPYLKSGSEEVARPNQELVWMVG
jgi:hypothetical protein